MERQQNKTHNSETFSWFKKAILGIFMVLILAFIFIICHFTWGNPFASAIRYTSTNNEIIEPKPHDKLGINLFGADVLYNIMPFNKGVIQFDNDVTYIGSRAYANKESLKSIIIPQKVKFIEYNAFSSCYNLESVTLPNNLIRIEEGAFMNCSKLNDIEIPEKVTTIEAEAFYGCEQLTSINIPYSVETIGERAFEACINLKEFRGKFASEDGHCLIADDRLIAFAPAGISHYVIPQSVTEISYYAFNSAASLESITIPFNVTHIESGAFWGCDALEQFRGKFASRDARCLIINENIIAFAPNGLIQYTIPNEATWIGDYAFASCQLIQMVTIPNHITRIGEGAFYNCTSLKSIDIPEGITKIDNHTFCWCWGLQEVNLPNNITEIGEYAFSNCEDLSTIAIPQNVTILGNGAFSNCTKVTSVAIPESIISIGNGVFAGCTNISEFTGKYAADSGRCLIVDNSITIDDVNEKYEISIIILKAFAPAGITKYSIPRDVTSIEERTFMGCNELTSITIPDSVRTIGELAFGYCDNLTEVYCKAIIPPDATTKLDELPDSSFISGSGEIFKGHNNSLKIYVPKESAHKYKSAMGWKEYADAIVGYDF